MKRPPESSSGEVETTPPGTKPFPRPSTILEPKNGSLVGNGHSMSPRASPHSHHGLAAEAAGQWVAQYSLGTADPGSTGVKNLEKTLPNSEPYMPAVEMTEI